MLDRSKQGDQYFGMAISPDDDRVYLANFGEEEPGPGQGRLAEFTPDGKLVTTWDGGRHFGDGTVTVLDPETQLGIHAQQRTDIELAARLADERAVPHLRERADGRAGSEAGKEGVEVAHCGPDGPDPRKH